MLEKIRKFAEKYNMLSKGDTVVCGLSGGADSTALLVSLYRLAPVMGFTLEAVHVNHCLRGDESDGDEQFCRELCQGLDVPFTAVSCDVRGLMAKENISCEEAARRLRYDIFARVSEGKKLATAHNADDETETMLLNLIRGTGLKGLAGVPPVRGNIIRPLLTVPRAEIEDFLRDMGQSWVTDSTNLTDDYTRNRIRHRIIPLMKELNGSLTETTVRTADTLRSENELIEALVADAMEKCCENGVFTGLSAYHEVIRRRCIARLLTEKGLPFSNRRLTDCDGILINGGKLNISGDLYFVSDGKTAELKRIAPADGKVVEKELVIGENRLFPHAVLICELMECDNQLKNRDVHKNLTFYLLDYDKIIGRTVVRSRKFGDRIRLRGRQHTSSVKKIINETIPVELRPTLHFIEDEMGTVFAENIGIADRAAPDENTVRLLKVTVVREGMECVL